MATKKAVTKATPAAQNEKRKTGRPSKYTPEIAQEMCNRLAEGEPLRQICRTEGFPAWQTVYDWMYRDDALGEKGVGLSGAIARARELGYDAMAEECLIIADNHQLGMKEITTVDAKGNESVSYSREDMLGHRKLQIETRLKLLAKFNPKKYGDRLALAGDASSPIKIEAQVEADNFLATILKNTELKKQVTANE